MLFRERQPQKALEWKLSWVFEEEKSLRLNEEGGVAVQGWEGGLGTSCGAKIKESQREKFSQDNRRIFFFLIIFQATVWRVDFKMARIETVRLSQ